MSIESLVGESLRRAWIEYDSRTSSTPTLPDEIVNAVDTVLTTGSAPNRQFLLAIAAGTTTDPSSNPASLQQQSGDGGVDRRGQAYKVRDALTSFRDEYGLTLKISQDAGVSNQWRAPEITPEWVAHRRKQDRAWAQGFLTITSWLREGDHSARAKLLLDFVTSMLVRIAVDSALDYPRFRVTPRIAMRLIREFLDVAPDRPDAMEAVVTVGARTLSSVLESRPITHRRDINSPDPIDIVISSAVDETVKSGIEVTDAPISLSKIKLEVVPAMLKLGLDRATVVSRGTPSESAEEIDRYINRAYSHFQQRIDLTTIDVIEAWLSFPGTPRDLATDFLWGIGGELDQHSKADNRRAWFNVLSNYAESVDQNSDTEKL